MGPLGGVLRRVVAVASALTFFPIVHLSGAPVVAAGPIETRGSVNQVYAAGLAPGGAVPRVHAGATDTPEPTGSGL